jgi:hypothetical protein
MMHLASVRQEVERPSVFDRACRILGDNLRLDARVNYLWTNGRWVPASLDDIMRRANERLKSTGQPQIINNPAWVIS